MKNLCKKINLNTAWILLFLVFFISVPLFLLPQGILAAAAVFLCVFLFVNKIEIKRFPLFIFVLALVLRLAIVIAIPTPPTSDFLTHFEASRQMIAGDHSYLGSSYFTTWAYQMGIVFFQSLFLRLWNDVMILKIINCLLSAATCVLVYKIARELTDTKASQCAALLYCLIPFTLFYPTILSNQYHASFLIYLGFYLLISKEVKLNTRVKYILFALLLAFADVFRPESIIPVFSLVLFLLITAKRETIKQNLIDIAIVLVVYFGVFKLISFLFAVTGISPLGLTNNDPLWKFVVGFNHDTAGRWNMADALLVQTTPETEIIKSRVLVPIPQLLNLFIEKIKVFWCGEGVEWTFISFFDEGLPLLGHHLRIIDDVNFLNAVSKWMMVFSYLLVAFAVIRIIRKKSSSPYASLMITQIFVTFGVYLLIEVQSRYLYHIQIGVMIVAAIGISALNDAAPKIWSAFRQSQKEDPPA